MTISAWIGSNNVGDELVHAGLRRLLEVRGLPVSAISLDPEATTTRHGGAAVRRPRAVAEMFSGRRAGPLVLGGGGLLQDETSELNLPYHLHPVAVARHFGRPVAGVGLGAGPLFARRSRRMVAATLSTVPLAVRDPRSAALLAELGLPAPVVAADLALELPDAIAPPVEDVLVLALRPWDGVRHRLPVRLRRASSVATEVEVTRMAALVDGMAGATGLPVRFVAFDGDKDEAFHLAVADRMHLPVEATVTADASSVVDVIAPARAVVAMRYHAAVVALLSRRPTLVLDSGPKVAGIVDDVGRGFTAVGLQEATPTHCAAALERAMDEAGAGVLEAALLRLRERGRANGRVIDHLLENAAPRPRAVRRQARRHLKKERQ